jgi:energy-converting hydrogenase Eha subunit H
MLYYLLLFTSPFASIIAQISIVSILIIVSIVFFVFLLLGFRKFFQLKAQNRRLSQPTYMNSVEDKKVYKDFKDGYLYG